MSHSQLQKQIPSLVQTLLLKHPTLLSTVHDAGLMTSFPQHFQNIYFKHPQSFISRFLAMIMESLEHHIPIHYILEIGKNYLVSIQSFSPLFRIEVLHLHTVTPHYFQSHPNTDPFYTLFRCQEWKSPLPWLIVLDKLLERRTIHTIHNFHGNQYNKSYTKREFLQRLQKKPLSSYEWDLRMNHRPSFEQEDSMSSILSALDLKVNQKHPQDIMGVKCWPTRTHFGRVLDFHPYTEQDWYESIMTRKQKIKIIRYKKSDYEPFPLYPE
uniref:Uncharacterized protein n=1 Tax=viral metagenome TaxID=1070528 RepID=A0A6C0D2R8_9ZZZZ